MRLFTDPMEGKFIRLEPIQESMREDMRRALDVDAENWKIQLISGRGEHFDRYWRSMQPNVTDGRMAFAVKIAATGEIVGTSSFLHISQSHRTLEIGSTFLHPKVRGTKVNPEMKLLMLSHAFERGALRAQLTVDSRNLRSQAAVAKLGAVKEGVIRRHFVTWTGHLRDSVIYSIIDTEWPDIRDRLAARLAA